MTNEEKFVNELIGYIFAVPYDDYMTMECLCRKLYKHELIAKGDGHWQPLDKRCEECIFVEGSHWCNGCDKTPKGMKEYDEYWAKADRKDEPQTNADQHVQHVGSVENNDDIIVRSNLEQFRVADPKDEPQLKGSKRLLKGKDEPQTDCSWRKPNDQRRIKKR